jgi:amino acid transporter
VSVASGADAVFSFLPAGWQPYKLYVAAGGIVLLLLMNLRGVKESVVPLVPIFLIFLGMHLYAIVAAAVSHASEVDRITAALGADLSGLRQSVGCWGIMILVLRAYGMGAGTYTGIEAVSNGLPILREPKVRTARRTLWSMAASLSVMVFGLMLAYLLFDIRPQYGKTFNAMVCEKVVAEWPTRWGAAFVFITLLSEGGLLFAAAQTGFVGGPNVLATMARDRWVPVRFALLSNRLVVQNGVLLIGSAALVTLLLSGGSVHLLVVLYSINVFITFSFSQLGMIRHWLSCGLPLRCRVSKLLVSVSGLALTLVILASLVILKFNHGGWVTVITTLVVIGLVWRVRREYDLTAKSLRRLDDLVPAVEGSLGVSAAAAAEGSRPKGPVRTAVLLVNGYGGIGLHSLLAIMRVFGDLYRRFVFVQVGVIDHAAFKGTTELVALEAHSRAEVDKYVQLMRRRGVEAEGVVVTGLDVAEELANLAPKIVQRYPNAVFFGGQIVFKTDSVMTRMLHNWTIFEIQRRLYQQGAQVVILPIRA